MTALERARVALAAGQVTEGLVRDLCDEIERTAVERDVKGVRLDKLLTSSRKRVAALGKVTAERDAALATIDKVRALHRAVPVYEMADHCGNDDEDHADEHHMEALNGEQVCFDSPIGDVWCEHCWTEDQEHADWPCPTIQTLGDQT